MKNFFKRFLTIALMAAIGFSMVGCDFIGSVIDKVKGDDKKSKETKVNYYIDISKDTDWDYLAFAPDGSSMVFNVDKSTGKPTLLYLKPDKKSDNGYTLQFKKNGLPDTLIYNDYIFYFDNYSGYKYDMAVIPPNSGRSVQGRAVKQDGTITTFMYGQLVTIDTDIYVDELATYQENNPSKYWNLKNLNESLGLLGTVSTLATCAALPFMPGAIPACVIGILSEFTGKAADEAFEGTTNDALQILINALNCVTADVVGCSSTVVGIADLASTMTKKDINNLKKKKKELDAAIEALKEKNDPPSTPPTSPVVVDVTGVSLDKTTLSLMVGWSESLSSRVSPANATNKATDWTSSNANIATVDKYGDVTAVAPGTATITVTTVDGGFTASCAVTVTATATSYNIGDKGPGSGIIFYHSAAGFTMADNGQVCHYLEATPNDFPGDAEYWSLSGKKGQNVDAFSEEIGAGRKNTSAILAFDPDYSAAKACRDYSGGGKTDWYLPSIGELKALYEQRELVGYNSRFYCHLSSTMGYDSRGDWTTRYVNFSNGESGLVLGRGFVHAIRAF